MRLNANLLFVLVVCFLIDRNFAAIFLEPEYEFPGDFYVDARNPSTHRGLLLSYSTAEKKKLCTDIFSAQLYLVPESGMVMDPRESQGHPGLVVESYASFDKYITDGLGTEEGLQFPLSVRKLGLNSENHDFVEQEDIFFYCEGQNFVQRNLDSFLGFYVSYVFRAGWWMGNVLHKFDRDYIMPASHINASPVYVPLKQEKLEEQYLNTRRILDTLKEESPEYVHLIVAKDQLMALSKWQQRYLCASTLSSPFYRFVRLEYSETWANEENNPAIEENPLALNIRKYHSAFENLESRSIICKGYEDGDEEDSDSVNVYLTGTYDNKDSIYVMREGDGGNFLDGYFTKVPLLMNAGQPIQQMDLFKNYRNVKRKFY